MSDLNNNKKSFNLPAYINIPFFLYHDNRLEKSAMLIAAFFYSLYTAGKTIKASKAYICQIACIGKTQYFSTLNQLEELGYIKRTGFTNRKKIQWVHCPESNIIVDESDTSPASRTNEQELNTSPGSRTKLVRDPEPILSGEPDTDIKEDTKDYKKLTTVKNESSSSSFFSQKQKEELLSYKLSSDDRDDELFLKHCTHHVEKQDNDCSKFQRFSGLKHILMKLYEAEECFKAKGFEKEVKNTMPSRAPTDEEFNQWKRCIPGYEWVGVWRSQQAKAG